MANSPRKSFPVMSFSPALPAGLLFVHHTYALLSDAPIEDRDGKFLVSAIEGKQLKTMGAAAWTEKGGTAMIGSRSGRPIVPFAVQDPKSSKHNAC